MKHIGFVCMALILAITSGCSIKSSNSRDAFQTADKQVKQEISASSIIEKYLDEMNREDYNAAAAPFGVKTKQELDLISFSLYADKHHTHEIKEIHKILHEIIDGNFAIYTVGVKTQIPNTIGYLENVETYSLYRDNGEWFLDNHTKDQTRLEQYKSIYKSKEQEINVATREYMEQVAKPINEKFQKENPNYKEELSRNQKEKLQNLDKKLQELKERGNN